MMKRLESDLNGNPVNVNKIDIQQRCWSTWGIATVPEDDNTLLDDSYV